MNYKPKNREELFDIIKEVITKQNKDRNYPYGLKDIHENASMDNIRSRGCGCENASTDNIRSRGLSETFYPYGLRDVDTSLITNMNNLFSCIKDVLNYKINRKIDWNDPRNNITQWNVSNVNIMGFMFHKSTFNQNINSWDVSNVINMNYLFYKSKFNQDISSWNVSNVTYMRNMFYKSEFNKNLIRWIFTLNKSCYIQGFNYTSLHEKKFGTIDGYEDFIEKQLTKDFIKDTLQNGNDIDRYKLLKIIKQYPHIVKNIDIDRELK